MLEILLIVCIFHHGICPNKYLSGKFLGVNLVVCKGVEIPAKEHASTT